MVSPLSAQRSLFSFPTLTKQKMNYPSEFSWTSKDNKKIYAKDWQVKNEDGTATDIKAVICLIHGLGEHLHRYEHFAAYFNQKKYVVISFDHYGHGKSGGIRGHVPSFQTHMTNVAELLSQAEERYPLLPKFLYGHSMGGNIAMNYALRNSPNIAGIATSGTWVTLPKPPSAILVGLARMLKTILPTTQQSNELDPNNVSSDQDEVQKYINDPLVHDKITFKAATEMLDAAKYLETYEGPINIPALLMHGSEDKLTSPNGSSRLYQNLKGDLAYKSWNGFYHEIHNEPQKQDVFDLTYKWMESKIIVWMKNREG